MSKYEDIKEIDLGGINMYSRGPQRLFSISQMEAYINQAKEKGANSIGFFIKDESVIERGFDKSLLLLISRKKSDLEILEEQKKDLTMELKIIESKIQAEKR